jgi:hypothetical protein
LLVTVFQLKHIVLAAHWWVVPPAFFTFPALRLSIGAVKIDGPLTQMWIWNPLLFDSFRAQMARANTTRESKIIGSFRNLRPCYTMRGVPAKAR